MDWEDGEDAAGEDSESFCRLFRESPCGSVLIVLLIIDLVSFFKNESETIFSQIFEELYFDYPSFWKRVILHIYLTYLTVPLYLLVWGADYFLFFSGSSTEEFGKALWCVSLPIRVLWPRILGWVPIALGWVIPYVWSISELGRFFVLRV